ncbi:MAG: iron ABC transporter permease [Acidobacteriota bacterium]
MSERRAARRRRSPRAPLVWVIPSLLTAVLVTVPLIYLVLRASENGLSAYLDYVWTPITALLLRRTLLLAIGAVLLAIALAVPLAWLVVRTDLPGRRVWAVVAALPLVFPSYVAALALISFAGPRGFLHGWLEPLTQLDRLPPVAYGLSGAVLVLGWFTYPYVYLPLVAALRLQNPAYEDSARSLGASRWRTFWTVTLPQLRAPLASSSLLVALYALSDFGAVSIVRYNTFTLSIYNAYRGHFDRTIASSRATILVLLTVLLIALEARLVQRLRAGRRRPSRPPSRVPLGVWRVPALVFVTTVALVGVGMPVGVVGFWAVRGLLVGADVDAAFSAVGNSLFVAALAAVISMVLSLPLALWSVRDRRPLARLVERLSRTGFALPGLVIALALVSLASRVPWLYQTVPLLALAYVVRFLPEATGTTRAALADLAPSFEEAGRSLGRTPLQVLRTLVLPLILPGVAAGGALVFLTSMKELPATLLLRPIGFETLATDIWLYAGEAIYARAALPALILLLVTAPPVYWLAIRPVLRERVPAADRSDAVPPSTPLTRADAILESTLDGSGAIVGDRLAGR